MNELELLISLRDEVPLTTASPAVEATVMATITQPVSPVASSPRTGGRRSARPVTVPRAGDARPRLRRALAVAAAVGVSATAVIGLAVAGRPAGPQLIPWSGRPAAAGANLSYPSLGLARTEAQLVDYATRAAVIASGRAPAPHEWVFVKTEVADSSAGSGGFLFGPPDKRVIGLGWIRVDRREVAGLDAKVAAGLSSSEVVHGNIAISPSDGWSLTGWKSIRYSYLASLPADPARLESVILANGHSGIPGHVAVFDAISTLLEGEIQGAWIPPKLAATMYRVLQRLPGVHFESGTDLAGRSGIGLYMVIDGWYKQELVINPQTYTYMGDKVVAITAHKDVGTDGTRYIRKGQVLGWEALLASAIVRRVGELP